MYKLRGLASLAEDQFEEPTSGGEGLDSSHFLRFGLGMAHIHVG